MPDLIEIRRVCIKCGDEKISSEFYRGRNDCKRCTLDRAREYREQNREAVLAGKKLWHAKNREECNSRSKAWYLNNKERHREINRAWNAKNREQVRKKKNEAHNRRKYGLTPEREKSLLEKQDNRCKCCDRRFSDTVLLRRDHCHTGGHFRGFICNNCNLIEGLARGTGVPIKALQEIIKRIEMEALFYA